MTTSAQRDAPHAGPEVQDRRSRQRQRRRDQVLEAAVALFTENGYDNTTMEEIADRADVARATVFNHFPRKIEFINEWALRRRNHAIAAVHQERLDNHDVSQILMRYMRELGRISTQTRAETVALMGAAVHATNVLGDPALGHELTLYMARGKSRGEVRATVDPAQAGLLLATGYFAVLANWIDVDPEPFDLTRRLSQMLDMLLHGLIAPEQQN